MGRPSRQLDSALAGTVRERLADRGLSLRDLAKTLGLNVSTLSRSLASQRFSRDVGRDLRRWLGGPDSPENAKREELDELLLILGKMRKLEARAEMLVRRVVNA